MNLPPGTIVCYSFFVMDQDNDIATITIVADPSDIEDMIAKATASFLSRDLRFLTEVEYTEFCLRQMTKAQVKRAAEVAQSAAMRRAIDPETLDAMIKAHHGREGGDA